jgi:hypothetical protein
MDRLVCGLAVTALLVLLRWSPAFPQDMPADYRAVLETLGRQGDYAERVLKVNLPRTDLQVSIEASPVPTPLGFGGWIAFTKGDGGQDVMMGDLVLTEDEVNPVMSAVLDNGLDVTALHNHFFWESPRIFYMHVHGHGDVADLARRVKPAIDLMGKVPARSGAGAPISAGPMDTSALARIVGHPGEQTGPVYKITIARPDLDLKERGAPVNARMGLNTWAAFFGRDARAVVAGDVAMLAHEVTPVLRTLRDHDIDIVAIHHHMIGLPPEVYFLHYWGRGPAERLAAAVRAAVDVLGKPAPSHPR